MSDGSEPEGGLIDSATAEQLGEALSRAYEDARKTETLADMDTFISFIVLDWLMSHGYMQHDESTDIEIREP